MLCRVCVLSWLFQRHWYLCFYQQHDDRAQKTGMNMNSCPKVFSLACISFVCLNCPDNIAINSWELCFLEWKQKWERNYHGGMILKASSKDGMPTCLPLPHGTNPIRQHLLANPTVCLCGSCSCLVSKQDRRACFREKLTSRDLKVAQTPTVVILLSMSEGLSDTGL